MTTRSTTSVRWPSLAACACAALFSIAGPAAQYRLAATAAAAAAAQSRPSGAAASAAASGLRLVDVAAASGLDLVNISGGPAKDFIVDANGTGAGWFDYDNDGDLDLLLVQGSTREQYAKGGDPMVALFQNDGRGRFRNVTATTGMTRRGWGAGTCIADIDNDGFRDVYVTAYGPDVLYRNTGNGTFTDITQKAGVADTRWSTGCAFADYDHDGDVDLYVAAYVRFDEKSIPGRGTTGNCRFMATDVFCGPTRLPGEPDVLYRNNGDGTFTDVTKAAGVVDPGHYGFGVVFTDLTDDGWPDIYVANDSVPNLFFRNRRDGTFVEEGAIVGVAVSGDGRAQAGMGVNAGDVNGDGLADLVVTNFSHDHNTLYEQGPPGVFTDTSYATGLASTAGPYLGWGVGLVDLDQDGRLDVFIANGHVYPEVDKQGLGTRYKQRKQVFLNTGGKLRHATTEIGGGLLLEKSSRGAAFGDYDNDGDLDVLVVNMNETPTLLRNDAPAANHWLRLQMVGTKSNRDGIGAQVTVQAGGRRQRLEVRGDGSYQSHSDIRPHVGLGRVTRADRVEVRWPSGVVDTATNLAADRFYVVREGAGVTPLPQAK